MTKAGFSLVNFTANFREIENKMPVVLRVIIITRVACEKSPATIFRETTAACKFD